MFNKKEYSVKKATFLGVEPIYQADKKGQFNIKADLNQLRGDFATLIGLTWCDRKYKIFLNVTSTHKYVVTDSDVIGHDIYLDNYREDQIFVFYHSDLNTSPSKLRVKKAYEKLKNKGFKCKFFASKGTAENYMKRQLKKNNQ